MPKRILIACGLLAALWGQANGQEILSPSSPAETGDSSTYSLPAEALTFAPTNDRRWFSVDYLAGWREGAHLSPLVTTSTAGTAQVDAGVLGKANTQTLLSGTVNRNMRSGFRLGAGYIFDQEYGLGAEAGFTFLPSQSSSFLFTSADHPILARPFTNATNSMAASLVVAFPGNSTGNIKVDATTGSFYEFHLDLSERIWEQSEYRPRIDGLFGYRFASFDDSLRISQHIVPSASPGTAIDSVDSFSTQNTFNGLDLGLRTTYSWDRLSLNLLAKASPGNMTRTVDIHGKQVTTVTGSAPATAVGGLYALSSNIGEHTRNQWTVLPEAAANLNWQVRSNVSLRLGYSALYLTKVARADNQVDFTVNPNLIPQTPPATTGLTPSRPAFQVHFSDLWVQTLNVGLDMTF